LGLGISLGSHSIEKIKHRAEIQVLFYHQVLIISPENRVYLKNHFPVSYGRKLKGQGGALQKNNVHSGMGIKIGENFKEIVILSSGILLRPQLLKDNSDVGVAYG
jgi:hypothetical protein